MAASPHRYHRDGTSGMLFGLMHHGALRDYVSGLPCRYAVPAPPAALTFDQDARAADHQPVARSHRHGVNGDDILPLAEWLVA